MSKLSETIIKEFGRLAGVPDEDLARPALLIPLLESPQLDAAPYLARLDAMGVEMRARFSARGFDPLEASALDVVAELNRYLFEDQRFTGNRERYEDPRNSFLNQVLERRTGIPITLALVYLEVARRSGARAVGVNFPGHFLLRIPSGPAHGLNEDLIVDPFHGGALLSEPDCRRLLEKHVGEDAAFDPELLAPATKAQILSRMLLNLKRIYVRMRSFPQARNVTDLLLAVNPSALTELRDRGLLAYHLNDFSAALRDLSHYLQLTPAEIADGDEPTDHEQIWEHVKTLRRRVASFN
ncbi:MAG TPA: transglutaminase-like domain-containing protein [Vicinamibacterales bacterium]